MKEINMNEAETRAELIDPRLKACGWGIVEGSKILREYNITNAPSQAHLQGTQSRHRKANLSTFSGVLYLQIDEQKNSW